MSSIYWSKKAANLSPYIPGEQPRDRKFIKLNTNENPYPPSPRVIEAIHNCANESLRLYPDPSCTMLREAVAERWRITPEQVFTGNGSDEILAFAFAAFFNSQKDGQLQAEPVLFPDITYSFYPVYAELWDIPFRTISLNGDFSIHPDDYKQSSGGIIFPNPNAPTGKALSINAVREIADAQEKNNRVVIIDEAYIAFASDKGCGSVIPFINDHPNLLVICTLSKEASLAGLRAGYAAGNAELIEGLCRIRDSFNSYTMDRLAQSASAAAIGDTVYYSEINSRICRTRDRITTDLIGMGFHVVPSQANFLFVSPPPASGTAAEFQSLLREKGILVRRFKQQKIENYLRISIGTDNDMDTLMEACREIINENN